MDDGERLELVRRALQGHQGLDAGAFDRVIGELTRASQPFGRDADGRLRVAFFDARSYEQEAFDRLAEDRISWQYIPTALSQETVGIAENCRVICIFVNDVCDAATVEKLAQRGVELVALRCAGFNNVDLKACQEHGITVVRVPAYSPDSVAEHAIALMLMLNRKLHRAYLRNRAGAFVLNGLTGFNMRGKSVGVVGMGRIGQALIERLLGFGCEILVFDKFPNAELAERERVTYVGFEELLESADIISLHVPLNDETHYLIDAGAISRMKRGAMLVNTSRGALIDTKALIDGLKTGKIGSAGLDVYEEEAGIFFHDRSAEVLTDDVLARLMTFHNVVVTSHQAFLTHEALQEIAETTRDNIHHFLDGLRGQTLKNSVQAE